jgi:hypothetical protein
VFKRRISGKETSLYTRRQNKSSNNNANLGSLPRLGACPLLTNGSGTSRRVHAFTEQKTAPRELTAPRAYPQIGISRPACRTAIPDLSSNRPASAGRIQRRHLHCGVKIVAFFFA